MVCWYLSGTWVGTTIFLVSARKCQFLWYDFFFKKKIKKIKIPLHAAAFLDLAGIGDSVQAGLVNMYTYSVYACVNMLCITD